MLHRVLSTSCYKRCGGHHALDFIRLKWQKFRFQFLLRQNVANYVYVADYVLKYAYFHLLSLKTRKHDFFILWIYVILRIMKNVSDFKTILKTCCIKCCGSTAANGVAAMMH